MTTHFFLGSWYLLRALTQSQPPSVLTTRQSCHLQWSAQEALGTLDPHPFSKCDFKEGMTQEEGAPQLNPGLGKGAPASSLLQQVLLPSSPHASGGSQENLDNDTETDSLVSAQRERPRRRDGPEHGLYPSLPGLPRRFQLAPCPFILFPELWICLAPVLPATYPFFPPLGLA